MYGFAFTFFQNNRILFSEPPVNVSAPTISGTPTPGESLNCDPGIWLYNTSELKYQWFSDSRIIPNADQSRYMIDPMYLNTLISCRVTASNVYGGTQVFSDEILIV
jgi:hypothetical protein